MSSISGSPKAIIGIIGGSGLYKIDEIENVYEIVVDTPFGMPSGAILIGNLHGVPIAFLPRHGSTHHLIPTEVPYQANIYAFKKLGVKYIISVSAVGSLQESIRPLDIVLVDQFIDCTCHRKSTFFGNGIVAHVGFSQLICKSMRLLIAKVIQKINLPPHITLHETGIGITIEGPGFSTYAESELYRSYNASVIGMTNVTEAKLACEAEIAYATICMVTDYDCWRQSEEAVTAHMVMENLRSNAETSLHLLKQVIKELGATLPESQAHHALQHAILTPLDKAPAQTVQKLYPILKPYLPK